MAKLSKDEETLLNRLKAKMEAPDEPGPTKHLNISVDLGDEEQVKRATRLGLFGLFGGDDDGDKGGDGKGGDGKGGDGGGGGDGGSGDDPPKRRGFFAE